MCLLKKLQFIQNWKHFMECGTRTNQNFKFFKVYIIFGTIFVISLFVQGVKERYYVDDSANLTCYSRGSSPPASLIWKINDIKV